MKNQQPLESKFSCFLYFSYNFFLSFPVISFYPSTSSHLISSPSPSSSSATSASSSSSYFWSQDVSSNHVLDVFQVARLSPVNGVRVFRTQSRSRSLLRMRSGVISSNPTACVTPILIIRVNYNS